MEVDYMSEYEDTLNAYIYDDDKLVTYKWLSKELELHVNIAKNILREYWEKKKGCDNLVATFMLIGKLDDNSIRVEVVRDCNLNAAKEKYAQLDCEHVYSLQKTLPDIHLLATAGDGDIRFSGIKCNENFWRTEEEIANLRYVGNPVNNNKPPLAKVVVPNPSEKPHKTSNSNSLQNSENKKSTSPESEKAKSISEKQDTDKKVSPPTEKVKPAGKGSKKPIQTTKTGMQNLFGKVKPKVIETNKVKTNDEKKASENSSIKNNIIEQNKREKEEKEKKEKEREREKERQRDEEKKREQERKKEREKDIENENKKSVSKTEIKNISKTINTTTNKSKVNKNKKDDKGKKRSRSKENGNAAIKRKRILICDSDTSEDEVRSEEEEPMEIYEKPQVSRKRSPSPPVEKRENGKRMIRKTIDKTYKDEDGFFVTKKIHIYEAVSDNEEEPQVVKLNPKPKAAFDVKTKTKQTNLMSFFKKS